MLKTMRGSTVAGLVAVVAGALGSVHCSPGGDDKDGSAIPKSGGGDGGAGGGSAAGGGSDNGGGTSFNLGGQGGRRPGSGSIDGGCASSTEEGVQIPANLMFVVDRSGSMNCCPPPVTDSARCEIFPTKEGCTDSKWDITRDALIGAIDGLQALGNISVGVTMFPTNNACGFPTAPDVEMAPLDDAHFSSVQTFLESVTPSGKTPLAGATMETYAYLQDTFQARLRSENTFVVVVTDGADTCAPTEMQRLVDELAEQARNINIRTFVIGAPGSETARLELSKLAAFGGTARSLTCDYGQNPPQPVDAGSGGAGGAGGGSSGAGGSGGSDAGADASSGPADASADAMLSSPDGAAGGAGGSSGVSAGGAPASGGAPATGGTSSGPSAADVCHFDMTTATDFAAELRDALDAISQSKELTCEFDVPANPDGRKADRDKVNVTFVPSSGGSEPVLQDTTAACDAGAEGWQYSEDGTKIVLCGSICAKAQADRGGRVEIVLGCPTEKIR